MCFGAIKSTISEKKSFIVHFYSTAHCNTLGDVECRWVTLGVVVILQRNKVRSTLQHVQTICQERKPRTFTEETKT